MGDRCLMRLKVPWAQVTRVAGILGVKPADFSSEENACFGVLEIEEVNYGGTKERSDLLRERIDYAGVHYDGDTYDGANFVALDGIEYEVQIDANGDMFVVFERDDTPATLWKAAAHVRKYLEMHAEFTRRWVP